MQSTKVQTTDPPEILLTLESKVTAERTKRGSNSSEHTAKGKGPLRVIIFGCSSYFPDVGSVEFAYILLQ